MWEKIADSLYEDDSFPFAMTCRYFRKLQKENEALLLERSLTLQKPKNNVGVSNYTVHVFVQNPITRESASG